MNRLNVILLAGAACIGDCRTLDSAASEIAMSVPDWAAAARRKGRRGPRVKHSILPKQPAANWRPMLRV